MSIEYVFGDATQPEGKEPRIIAHICNDTGLWGRSFSQRAISKKWSEPERRYNDWYEYRKELSGDLAFAIGNNQFLEVEDNLMIANMISQHGERDKNGKLIASKSVDLIALQLCLKKLAEHAKSTGASVHMGRIGCGKGGAKWSEVEPLINKTLISQGVSVKVYDKPNFNT